MLRPDIIDNLVSEINPWGNLTDPDLKLAALVLYEATIIVAVSEAHMAAPPSGSDNTSNI